MPFTKSSMLLAIGAAFVGSVQAFTGEATFFDPSLGTCGFFNSDSDFIVALNAAQANSNAHCGQTITVNFQGKSVVAEVVDTCRGCGVNGIDLSPAAYEALSPLSVGRIQVDWNFN